MKLAIILAYLNYGIYLDYYRPDYSSTNTWLINLGGYQEFR